MALNLGTPATPTVGGTCTVGRYLVEHPDNADDLRVYLADPAWAASMLRKALDANGIYLSEQALTRHRRGVCKCVERGIA